MGEVHKLYPTAKDSHNGDIFLEFKKIFNQREKWKEEKRSEYEASTKSAKEELLNSLLENKQYEYVTESWRLILCTVLDFHGKNHTDHPYGIHHHILLEQEGKWDGCAIEHRMPPRSPEEHFILNGSSFVVNNQKFWWNIHALRGSQKDGEANEPEKKLKLA